MKTIGIVVIAVMCYRIVFCLSGFLRTIYYEKKYKEYLSGNGKDFSFYSTAVKKLFHQASVQDIAVSFTERAGYGYFRNCETSLFLNLSNTREDVVDGMKKCFLEAKGTFLTRFLECFSPLYWIQVVVFFPRKICEFFEISEKSIASKILQMIYWIAAPLLLVFRNELYQFIVHLIQQV